MSKLIWTIMVMFLLNKGYSQTDSVVNARSPKNVYLRVFKFEKELEVWMNYSDTSEYQLYKRFKICMISGHFGPKRREGDLQVPEGFYFINSYRPQSSYHMSLGVDYPNESDKILSPYKNLGGQIYVHGGCVSIGCIALTNEGISEVYGIVHTAYKNGQTHVPMHIYPVNYKNHASIQYYYYYLTQKPELTKFEENLKEGFYFFEQEKKMFKTYIDDDGHYIFIQ